MSAVLNYKEAEMLGKYIETVRKNVPLVHNITNYVTVNDVANVLLACGGSPIMSDEPADVEDITSICGGLNINIGTLNKSSIEAMHKAGKRRRNSGTYFSLILSAQVHRLSGRILRYPSWMSSASRRYAAISPR